jgi:predicted nucleic acid-binding protein
VVLLEALSDPSAEKTIAHLTDKIPLLKVTEGYWARAAMTRRTILSHKLKAKLGDALVAQSCIDHDVPLITRDKDFRHYAKHCGLKLYA